MLGASVQLCALPWLGFVPGAVTAVPAPAAGRLGIPAVELSGYGLWEQTRTEQRKRCFFAGCYGQASRQRHGGISVISKSPARRATASSPAGGWTDWYLAANASRGRVSRCTYSSTGPR